MVPQELLQSSAEKSRVAPEISRLEQKTAGDGAREPALPPVEQVYGMQQFPQGTQFPAGGLEPGIGDSKSLCKGGDLLFQPGAAVEGRQGKVELIESNPQSLQEPAHGDIVGAVAHGHHDDLLDVR